MRWMVVIRSNLRVQQTQPLAVPGLDAAAEMSRRRCLPSEVIDEHHGLPLSCRFTKFLMNVVFPRAQQSAYTLFFMNCAFLDHGSRIVGAVFIRVVLTDPEYAMAIHEPYLPRAVIRGYLIVEGP